MKKEANSAAKNLRKRAEELLRKKATETASTPTEADYLKLIHELQVHQIELELVNEELKLAKDRADAASEKYAELYDFAPSGYFTLNRNGKILELNLHGAKMMGKERSFLINSSFGFFIKEDARTQFFSFLDEIFRDNFTHSCEVPISTNDHVGLYVQLTGIITDNQDQCRVTAVDISERKKAEDSLRQNLAKYQTLVDSFPIAITISDKDGNIIETNEKALQLLGLSREEHLSRKIKGEEWKIIRKDGEIFPQDEYASVRALKENRLVENVEMGIVKSDEVITWLNVTAAPIPVENLGVVIAYSDITKRMLAEEALRSSQQLLEEIINTAPVRIFWKDRNLVYIGCNYEFAKDAGFSDPKDIIGKDDYQLGWHQQAELYRTADLKVIESGIPRLNIEEPQTSPDGNEITLLTNKIPWRNFKGEADGIIGTYVEITSRKKMENALRESEERLRLALMATNDVVWDWDIVNDRQKWNEAGRWVFGWTEIVENSVDAAWWVERVHPEDRPRVHDSFFEVVDNPLAEHWEDEYRFMKADGTYAEVLDRGYVLRDNQGKAVRMIGAMLDITERKKAEKALKDSELFANTIANTTPALLYLYDFEQAKNIWTNEAHKRFFEDAGKDSSELEFSEISQFTHPDDFKVLVEHANELLNDTSINNYEMDYRLKWQGNWKWMKLFVSVFKRNEEGKPVQILGALFDIDDQKKNEQDLIAAKEKAEESDRLKSAFLANMSHEIRTPMNGIIGFTELLKEPDLLRENQMRFIGIIEKSGERMLSTINDIIDFSKIEAGLMEVTISETNINDQLIDIYNFFKPETDARGLKFSFNNALPENEVKILTDADKLYATLTNLVKNAIKFTSKGSIEFGYVLNRIGDADERSRTPELQFYVNDTGIGIPQNRLKAIFDRFIQADISDKRAFQGSGLGLTISKAYVEMLGGKIWVESQEENTETGKPCGTTFYFTIPVSMMEVQTECITKKDNEEENKDDLIPKGQELKVLIAEDEEISDMVLSLKIRKISREIFHAKTGKKTVEICRKHPDLDLVLMDIKMPDMNGYQATRLIRTFNQKVVIIAQTAYAMPGDREKALEAGCNDYLTKPIKKTDLARVINRIIKKDPTIKE